MAYIDQFFEVLIEAGASDFHMAEGQPPKIRRHGEVVPIREEVITRDEAGYMLSEICGAGALGSASRKRAISISRTR